MDFAGLSDSWTRRWNLCCVDKTERLQLKSANPRADNKFPS